MHSSLVDGVFIAYSGNYQKGRKGKDGKTYKPCRITPHQMSGKLTAKQCAVNIFQTKGRKASANYCIGYDGSLVCNVKEEDRAYTSSSWWNDCQAITIEVSNSGNHTDKITKKSWNTLVKLCVDICKRYNFKLVYDGTKNGSLTRHNMFANTDCPGKYLQSRFPELVKVVNAQLESKPKTSTKKGYSGSFPSLGLKGYLKKGDKGNNVKKLQQFLNWCINAKLTVDGSFGDVTLKAVKNFQEKYGLKVDGYFGKASLKKAKSIKK